MYTITLQGAFDGNYYSKQIWSFTKRGLKRKVKKFYKNRKNDLTSQVFCDIICM